MNTKEVHALLNEFYAYVKREPMLDRGAVQARITALRYAVFGIEAEGSGVFVGIPSALVPADAQELQAMLDAARPAAGVGPIKPEVYTPALRPPTVVETEPRRTAISTSVIHARMMTIMAESAISTGLALAKAVAEYEARTEERLAKLERLTQGQLNRYEEPGR